MSEWTISRLLNWTTDYFMEQGQNTTPRLDAQLLLAHALGLQRIDLYIHYDKPILKTERERFRAFVKRRACGEPVAYIIQEKYWFDMCLYVDKRVLVPRPETELLLTMAFEHLEKTQHKNKISDSLCLPIFIDLCTGSGAIALGLAKHYPQAHVVGVDICPLALQVAQLNQERLQLANVSWLCADVLDKTHLENLLRQHLRTEHSQEQATACLLVANPPYATQAEWPFLEKTVRDFEPQKAIVSDGNGLGVGLAILDFFCTSAFFKAQAFCAMELAHGQPHLCSQIHKQTSACLFQTKQDWDGKERFLLGERL